MFVLVAFVLSGLALRAAPVAFDIPIQPAPAALKLFEKQSGRQAIFIYDDLREVKTGEVKGELEPLAALEKLFKDTGFEVTQSNEKSFVIGKAKPVTGSVKGRLAGEGGKNLPGALVAIRETGQSTETDKYGQYVFPKVAAGTYVLVATADGYQTLHITDVTVGAGRDLTLGKEEMRKRLGEVTNLEPLVVHADAVTELEKVEVTGLKEKPYANGNADIPRTINDAQPYYMFSGAEVMTSGASSVEDFLRRRLTMNLTAFTNAQYSTGSSLGNTSTINLRGLGSGRTLILVNGRRLPSTPGVGGVSQPDLNNLSLAEIERIEVLPSSASGLYGGSALGGVVNIILRRDYVGGESDARYDNTVDTDAPIWTVAVRYGGRFAGTKGRFKVSVSRAGGSSMLMQDRLDFWQSGFDAIQGNSPTFFSSATTPWLGSLPNITPSSATATTLTLDNGVSLGSRNTFVPAGTNASTSLATLYAGLLANAGQWNFTLPPTPQAPSGLQQIIGSDYSVRTFTGSLTYNLTPVIELYADFSYRNNDGARDYLPISYSFQVSAASPINPFTTAVRLAVPMTYMEDTFSDTMTRSLRAGARLHLPGEWEGDVDYVWGDATTRSQGALADTAAVTNALNAGTLNPFVDTLSFPLSLERFVSTYTGRAVATNEEFSARASGPLPSLPWGKPQLTTIAAYRIEGTPETVRVQTNPATPTASNTRTYFPGRQTVAQGYAELEMPLVAEHRFPGLDTLRAQLGLRQEHYRVNTGTTSAAYFPATGTTTYSGPTQNGQPYFSSASYASTDHLIALKYHPVPELMLRASASTAFTPPISSNLVKNLTLSNATIVDPKNGGASYQVQTETGGNPDTKPENAKSKDIGLVWQPKRFGLDWLRLGVQWQTTEIFNQIAAPGAQAILSIESLLPDRVQRDAAGYVTLIDASAVNLFRTQSESWDFSVDCAFKSVLGNFDAHANVTYMPHRLIQYSLTSPSYETSGYNPMENAGGTKTRGTLRLNWRRNAWEAGWTATYVGTNKAYGAIGGPVSLQSYGGGEFSTYIIAQGGDTVASNTVHDAYVGYTFERRRPAAGSARWLTRLGAAFLSDTSLQLGVNNVFNRYPSVDVINSTSYYFASFASDLRLRTYWVRLRKPF